MKATLLVTSFGILAFNEETKLVDKALFPKNPEMAAGILAKIETGNVTDELAELVKRLAAGGYDTFIFENDELARKAREALDISVEVAKPSQAGEVLRSGMEQLAVESGFAKDAEELRLWTHSVTMELAKLRVRGAVEKRDLLIAQGIQALDDLDKVINLFMSHIREWYGIHFPELDRLVDKHETYSRLILKLGSKNNFTLENLEKEDIPKGKAEAITKTAGKSMGADLTETDLAQIQALCKSVLDLYELRQGLERYLEKAMDEVAPNTKALAGSLLGARLIAVAGGLSTLARRPASTIQVLGAEKALFRSLKTGTRPPKHGIIFQHTLLHDAKKWQRGKIARALAGKLAIAARADAFGGAYIGDSLKASLDRRIEEIRAKYAEPPPMVEREQKPRPRREKWRKRRERYR